MKLHLPVPASVFIDSVSRFQPPTGGNTCLMICTAVTLCNRAVLVLLCALITLGWARPLLAQSSSINQRQAKEEAIKAIPLGYLNPVAQKKTLEVLEKTSLYRRLPVSAIEADPDYYRFLVRNPEVIVEIWRLMGVTKMVCERTGEYTYRCDDGAGTVSEVELLYGTENLHLFWASGSYANTLNKKPIDGDCLMLLRTSPVVGPSGKPTVQSTLDVFLTIDNMTASLVAKTLAPVVGKTADHNFLESLKFVQRLNETTGRNGPGVQGMADRLEGLTEPVREQFIEIVDVVYERTQQALLRSSLMVPGSMPSRPSTGVIPVSGQMPAPAQLRPPPGALPPPPAKR
ncbi:MAG: hypothetical protein ACKO81_04250 [Planctomycetota bacterium]